MYIDQYDYVHRLLKMQYDYVHRLLKMQDVQICMSVMRVREARYVYIHTDTYMHECIHTYIYMADTERQTCRLFTCIDIDVDIHTHAHIYTHMNSDNWIYRRVE